ncbi:MAG: PAS domain-containing protein, partial [Promethearchaeota archaeon]
MITNQEERPLKEDSFLSLLWNIIDDLIIVLNHDSQYKIEKINNSKILKRLGYFKKDILNKSFLDFVYKGDIKILIKLLKKADYFNPKTHEIRLEGKEKETIWVEIKVIKFIKDDKKRILVILKDITKQKNLEYLFRLNEERFRKIANQIPEIRFWKLFSPKHVENALQNSYKILENVMENIPQYVYWKDLNLSFLGCNANFAKLAGLEDSIQIINKNNNGLDWNPKLLKEIEKKEITVIKNREPEFNSVEEWELKHGIKIWVQINRIPLFDAENEMRGILVTFEDISELKKAFELLQIEHDKLERIMETSPVGIIIINSRGKITYVNSFVEKILQIKKEECFNLSILEYMDNILEAENVDIEDSSNINNLLSLLKEPLSNVKLKVKLSNGNIVLLLLNSSPLLDRNKKLENVIIIIEDITEREQARQKIKESEEKYKNLLETSKVGVLEVDLREQKLSYMNPMLMNITGHNNKEFVYENFMKKIVHPDDVNNLLNSNEDDDVEFRILTKNRNLKRLHGKKSNLYDDEGNLIGFRLWVEDITEKKRYEELIYELNVNFLNFTTDTKKNIQLLLNTCVKLLRGTLILYTNKIEKDGKVLYKIMSNKGDFLELSESEFKNNYFLYQYYKENHDFPQEYFDLDILKKSRSDYFVKKYGLKSCYG